MWLPGSGGSVGSAEGGGCFVRVVVWVRRSQVWVVRAKRAAGQVRLVYDALVQTK